MLSVIIPVYNVADTLKRCVGSVLSQHIDNMEVIIVDDGSTDGSSKLCDEYAEDSRITVIHQANAGLSAARNTGIDLAKRDFLTFIDSDDYLEPNTYKPLLDIMQTDKQCDMLEYSISREVKDGSINIELSDNTYTDMRRYWLDGKAYSHTYACNKIYKRELFENVRFPEGKKFEDVSTLWSILNVAKKVRTTTLGLYHYTYNLQGITQQADGNSYRDLLEAHLPIVNDRLLLTYKGFRDYYKRVVDIQLQTYIYTGNKADIKLPALPYHDSLKLRLLQLLGMNKLCGLFRLYHSIV